MRLLPAAAPEIRVQPMKQLLIAFAKNTVFANIGLIMILVAGAVAMATMIRENFPEFSLDIITVSVAYPGADPEEVEEGVSRKIEEALEGIEGLKQVTTHSNENAASVTIEVKEGYEVSEVLDRVRSQIDAISTFPVDAEAPVITELTLKDPVVLLYLSGRMDEGRLKEWSERIKDDLQQLPEISQVSVFGTVFNESSFVYRPEKGIGDYLAQAGGPRKEADKSSIYVLRADGSVVSRRQSGFLVGSLNGMQVMPGDTIVVPEDFQRTTWTKDLKDWTQIFYQFGLGAAALKVIRD